MEADEIQEQMEAQVDPESLKSGIAAAGGAMTLRERYRRTMFFQRVDRAPNFEFGYWEQTLKNWRAEGLPPEIDDEGKAYAYFGIENWRGAYVNTGLVPRFEHLVLEEDEQYVTYRDGSGVTARINKHGNKSIPHYIDWMLTDRASWEEHYKWRLQPSADRVPENWAEQAAAYRLRDYPLSINFGSLIGIPRNWIGFEEICLMIYDDPELLEEIVETLCVLSCTMLEKFLVDVEFDFASGWEDICFNSGPIVSYDFFKSVIAPRYRRISDLLNKHGINVIWTDCDGNIMPILDCLVDGGHTCIFPAEVHGGTDPVEVRKRYPQMRIQGGFDKMMLLKGKDAIRGELERLKPVFDEGGFLPGVDHRVQADVSLENYKYYMKLKRDILGVGGVPQYDESKVG